MQLVVGDVGRGVQEALATVVVDVLPVAGDIEHRSQAILLPEACDDLSHEVIGLAHGIVVGSP